MPEPVGGGEGPPRSGCAGEMCTKALNSGGCGGEPDRATRARKELLRWPVSRVIDLWINCLGKPRA